MGTLARFCLDCPLTSFDRQGTPCYRTATRRRLCAARRSSFRFCLATIESVLSLSPAFCAKPSRRRSLVPRESPCGPLIRRSTKPTQISNSNPPHQHLPTSRRLLRRSQALSGSRSEADPERHAIASHRRTRINFRHRFGFGWNRSADPDGERLVFYWDCRSAGDARQGFQSRTVQQGEISTSLPLLLRADFCGSRSRSSSTSRRTWSCRCSGLCCSSNG